MRRAEAQLKDAERNLAAANLTPAAIEKIEESKTKATEWLTAAQAQLATAQAEGQPLIDAAAAAREAVKTAEADKLAAQNEAKIAAAKLAPVSVFISRKTQRLYVRQAFQPIFDSPVTISNPDAPIGTVIYTALNYTNEGADVRWNALAMYANVTDPECRRATCRAPRRQGRHRGSAHRHQGRQGRAGARLHSPRRHRAHQRGRLARLIPDHFRRGAEPRDRQGHRLRRGDERRAARRAQDSQAQPLLQLRQRLRSRYRGYYGRSPFSWW